MMSEIEKLYENAGVDKDCKLYANYGACPDKTKECTYCEYYVYPEFTAEKQIEIESVIFRHNFGFCELQRHLGTEFNNGKFVKHYFVWNYMAQDDLDDDYIEYNHQNRNIALAGFVNRLWQDLTEEEKQQVKEILE